MESYDEMVERLADTESNELIPNGLVDHAKVIVKNLLSHADTDVAIFSTTLKPEIYDDDSVISGLGLYLNRPDARLKILLQEPTESLLNSRFLQAVASSGKNYSVKKVEKKSDQRIKEHFIVMDKKGFRFCPDKTSSSAIASFNQPRTAENLRTQFDVLFDRASDYDNLMNDIKENLSRVTMGGAAVTNH